MQSRSQEEAQERRKEAQALIGEAKVALAAGKTSVAESLCRGSLQKLREAYLFEPTNPLHREDLHKVGRMVHDTFGCVLEFREGSYRVTCPVLLSHSKAGFSIGGSAKVICSVCGQDNLTCPHVKGRKYDGVVANRWLGYCSVCLKKDCGHAEGQVYDDIEACGIVTEIDLDHVALVRNPSNPLCVVTEYSLTNADLLEMLPEKGRDSFVYGETVVECHHCRVCCH
jgi:hypothetical protein